MALATPSLSCRPMAWATPTSAPMRGMMMKALASQVKNPEVPTAATAPLPSLPTQTMSMRL